jgi:polyhydroxyalkanoate synthesis regulator phasin
VLKTSGVATKTEMDELKAQIAELKEMLSGTNKPSAPADEAAVE